MLLELGNSVTVITGAPAGFFIRELPSACLAVRKASLDFGAKQKDAFSVDMAGAVHDLHHTLPVLSTWALTGLSCQSVQPLSSRALPV